MQIKDIMTNPAVTIEPNTSVLEAAKVMQSHNIGAVPVCQNDTLLGIVTDRDILIRNTAFGKDPKEHKVKDIMTTKVDSVSSDMDITEAAQLMAKDKVKRLPVVDDGKITGMVTLGDMAVTRECMLEVSEALCELSVPCHKKHPAHAE